VSSDSAGRVVVPKRLRDALGFSPGTPLEIDVVDGHLELSAPHEPARLVTGPHGSYFAATGTPLTDENVRRTPRSRARSRAAAERQAPAAHADPICYP
jgi:AbrB family looped-hinge helix DNA binding protein